MELIKQSIYKYTDIIFNNLKESIKDYSIISLSEDILFLNMQPLLDIIKKHKVTIRCLDYTSLKYLDSILKEPITNMVILVDDSKRINREYIDITSLKNIKPIVPLDYLIWGLKFNGIINTYCFKKYLNFSKRYIYTSFNSNEKLSLVNLKKIYKKIEKLSKMNPRSDIEKIYLVSDYLQSQVSYYDSSDTERISGLVETILNKKAGLCIGIASLTTLLLNNEIMNVETESVAGSNHAWNKVGIDKYSYYVDNTWSITRGTNSISRRFTKDFNNEFLLTGSTNPEQTPESAFIYPDKLLQSSDYPKLDYERQFIYQESPKSLSLARTRFRQIEK